MKIRAVPFLPVLAALGAIVVAAYQQPVVIKNQGFLPFADAPINYRSAPLRDPIKKLQERLDARQVKLDYEPEQGYLRSVLQQLQVPVSSQGLVFSKTSFQFPQITPATPRALYFNDDVYVGRVHDGKFLEFISFDPDQGAIFYVLDEHKSEHPQFERAAVDCVQCHVATSTRGVPGVMLRSVSTRPTGYQAAGTKSYITGHESPLNERWGGWYLTGSQGVSGMGDTNLANVQIANYLTKTSDIVSLLVLAHQTQMHNLITQVNYQTRLMLSKETPESHAKVEASAEQLVEYLFFAKEAPLGAAVSAPSPFVKDFAARGPFDPRGRTLRQFDLYSRLFRYPCSYLIYSDDFNAIPEPAKSYVNRRIFEVLNGSDRSPTFQSLASEDRRAILEILVATKRDVPREWRDYLGSATAVANSFVRELFENFQRPHEPALTATLHNHNQP